MLSLAEDRETTWTGNRWCCDAICDICGISMYLVLQKMAGKNHGKKPWLKQPSFFFILEHRNAVVISPHVWLSELSRELTQVRSLTTTKSELS